MPSQHSTATPTTKTTKTTPKTTTGNTKANPSVDATTTAPTTTAHAADTTTDTKANATHTQGLPKPPQRPHTTPRTILYARVSTLEQTIQHQRTQAEAMGYVLDEVVWDEGVSGVTTRLADRPQGKRLYDLLRPADTLVVRWVDRLGRNYEDVSDTLRDFMRRGVVVKTLINGLTFDGATTDPVQQAVRDALIAFMAATSQAQAEATRQAQKAGIAHAKAKTDSTPYKGRKPNYTRAQMTTVVDLLAQQAGTTAIARATGLSRQSVLRIKADPAGAERILSVWGM